VEKVSKETWSLKFIIGVIQLGSYKRMHLIKKVKSVFNYVFDKNIPINKKIYIIFGFVYLLFPFDIIPDPILGLGILDDITILIIIYTSFKRELERYELLKEKRKNKVKPKSKENILNNVDYSINNQEGDD
jgi:uncharacterized membrane protein YkvA (DUF1232 family)